MDRAHSWEKLALPLLLTGAAILSVLGANSALRSDEVWSVQTVHNSFSQMMAQLKDDVHPPLYYLLLFPWVRVFGWSEIAIRGLSGLLFVLSVLATYKWVDGLNGPHAALLAGAILMTCPLALVAAQMARMYSLLMLASVLSTWAYTNVFVEQKRSWLAFWIAANILGTMTHIWFFFLLFAQGAHWLLRRRKDSLRFVFAAAASLAPYAVLWLPILIKQIRKTGEATAWLQVPGISAIATTAFFYSGVVALALPLLVYRWFLGKQDRSPAIGGLLLMLIVALAVPFAISQVKPVFYSRFTVIGLPLFSVALATWLGPMSTWRTSLFLTTIAGAGCAYAIAYPPCDAQTAVRFLNSHEADGGTAVFTALSRAPIDYYGRGSLPHLAETSFPAEIDTHPGYEGNVLAKDRKARYEKEAYELVQVLKQRHGRIFLFQGFHPELDQLLVTRLSREFHALQDQTLTCKSTNCYFTSVTVFEPADLMTDSSIDIKP